MDKEDILKRSRREKDEGLTYAQDRGRQYGVVGFLVLFLVIMIYNMVRGLDNSLPLTLFWAYLSCEAAGRYFCLLYTSNGSIWERAQDAQRRRYV